MPGKNISSRWLIVPALFLAFCSRGNPPSPASPSGAVGASVAGDQGIVGASAAGDVKSGPIEINLVRVAQADGVPAFYASAGGVYVVRPNLDVEIYIQIWTSDSPLAEAPRLIVEWGDGEKDNIHCGPCRLSRTYGTGGLYTVTVTMDDRVGGTTKRTFTLDSRNRTPTTSDQPIASHTAGGQTVYRFASRPLPPTPTNLASWYQQICEAAGLRPVSCDHNIFGSLYDASAWNAVILGTPTWSCNVSSGVMSLTGWPNIITFHIPLSDDRGLCENGCSITGNDVFPICTDAP